MTALSAFLPFDGALFREASDHFSVLPTQFFPCRAETPQQALMLAILEDLVICLVKESQNTDSVRSLNLLQEDLEFLQEYDVKFRDYPLSFTRCCHVLNLDPDVIRQAILNRVFGKQSISTAKVLRSHKTASYNKARALGE